MTGNGPTRREQNPEEVRAEIEKAREQIQSSVVALRYEMATATDWRKWVRGRPAVCMGIAFAVGFYFGMRAWTDPER
jgi:ElaB/YqjD/DUF883 family membrane-anchored ribosome-binding protein